ncbi:phosphatase PAP2 family protein [Clostridium thermarum]|uniref:phosphatase PAP2 family protein n=1 Tax=Clostridium thermarum TaxID=1716543 RepID=UPI001123C89C|nr:phosphatase PAP2 family protein [Clostridium thermarum]
MWSKIKENWKHLMFMLAIPAVSAFYPLFNNAKNGAQMVFLPIDYKVPFIKEFIIPYIAWYPFIVLTMVYLCLKDKKVYYRTLTSIILGFISSFAIFYVFQTHVPRPEVVGDDIFSVLVRLIYSNDQPYNCFPSLHVLESHLMVMGVNALENKSKKVQYFVIFTSVMIILSTQFIKQHVVIDIIGGLYLAEVIFNAVPGLKRIVLTLWKRRSKILEG